LLQTIAQFYETHHPKMIVMPVRFENGNTPLQTFQQMDLSGLIGITAGSLHWNFPVMANGANLAYEKKVFQQVNGFEGNEQMPGGDDIMLLLKIKKQFPKSIKFLKNDSVIVTTKTVVTLQEFYNQRLRWISKSGKFGDWKITFVLTISYLFNVIVLTGLFIGDFDIFIISLFIIMLKWIVEFYLVNNTAKFLKHHFTIFNYLWCNVFHQLYVVVFGLLGTSVEYEWKGRKY
jgi:cellulose synthase/poly-beta-1,6-N-acetylglucosamine synthase-like glycosyltransferase